MLLKVLAVCTFAVVLTASAPRKKEGSQDWWKTAVFYQIYPRSFKDSDNNGVGDLNGVLEKLDHLVDLGVTALWLSPIYKSPQKDHGYDISDFRDVDEIFGTLSDFDNLLKEAHNKGLKVVMDFVPNHSSDEHEWFSKSENSVAGYEDYYVWVDGKKNQTEPPNNWISYFHGSAWKYSDIRQKYYLHQFVEGQPDLNFRNPKVVEEMNNVLLFWLDRGVDGFRVDTVPSLVEVSDFPDEPLSGDPNSGPNDHGYLLHPYTNDQPETYAVVYQWRELLDKYTQEYGGDARVMMTESYSPMEKLIQYYGNETHNGAHFSFNFLFITKIQNNAGAFYMKETVDSWFAELPDQYTSNWVMGNHDQHRVATSHGVERVDAMNLIAMMLPGVAITYNGEEIGMENGHVTWEQGQDPKACNGDPNDFDKNSRDFERTPYQWDATTNAGFNEGAETWLPVSEKYLTCNLDAQKKDQGTTHYSVYKDMIRIRQNDIIKYGNHELYAFSDNVLAIDRNFEGKSLVLVVNLNKVNETINLGKLNVVGSLNVELVGINSHYKKGDAVEASEILIGEYDAVILSGTKEQ